MGASEEHFERLYRAEYAALVAYFLRRVDDREVARDLAAETFRIAWTRREEAQGRGWLFGVARHLVVDEYRRRDRDRRRTEELGRRLPDDVDDRAEDVRSVLDGLPDAAREVLTLTYWDGLGAAEIATVLGISRSAVWVRLHRARRAFSAAWSDTSVPASSR